jgi:hypothetical protein
MNYFISMPLKRTPMFQERPSVLKRERPALKNLKLNFFLVLWLIFSLLDPDLHSLRIRIRNTETNCPLCMMYLYGKYKKEVYRQYFYCPFAERGLSGTVGEKGGGRQPGRQGRPDSATYGRHSRPDGQDQPPHLSWC